MIEAPAPHQVDADRLRALVADLTSGPLPTDGVDRLAFLRAAEEAKAALEGAQAVVTAAFAASQRAVQAEAGVPAERRGRGVAAQVALARRESPHRGQRHLGLAVVLEREMPHTLAALRTGRITEWTATILARETGCLSVEDRAHVDEALAADPDRLESMSVREVEAAAREIGYRLDPAAVVNRRASAEADRRVSIRPAPDVMARVHALLPVVQGVAVWAALVAEADRLRGTGDPRSRNQIMADTLVERITGQATATGVPVMVNLVLSDQALVTDDPDATATLDGYGSIPPGLARDLIRQAHGQDLAQLRRLYATPKTGRLVAMESASRCFPTGLATFLRLRDQVCRTPWCDAPIRHADHVRDAMAGGPTSAENGQGLCEACNHAKQAAGWHARSDPDAPGHTVVTVTPTGQTYRSHAPPAPKPLPLGSRGELYLVDVLLEIA